MTDKQDIFHAPSDATLAQFRRAEDHPLPESGERGEGGGGGGGGGKIMFFGPIVYFGDTLLCISGNQKKDY